MVARSMHLAAVAVALAGALTLTIPAVPAGAAPAGPGSFSAVIDWSNFVAVHMAVSPAGDVLMWDREDGLTSARRWSPSTGAFVGTPGLVVSLFCAFQTRLPGGQVLVVGGTALKKAAGGTAEASTGLEQARIFDWASNTWSVAASMKTPRWYPTVVALPDGRQLALGGQLTKGVMANVPELYDPATNTWTELPRLAESTPPGLYPQAVVGPNGKVFVVKNALRQSAYMDVNTQTWTTVTKSPPAPGAGNIEMYESGKLLAVNIGLSGTESWVIDLNTGRPAWRQVGSLQFKRRKFNTVLLPDGRVMAIGGSSDGSLDPAKAVLTPEIWDPITETWSVLPNLAVPRMYHSSVVLLPDGRILIAGGGRFGSAPNFPSAQIYRPHYLSLANRPAITKVPGSIWTAGSTVSLTVDTANGVGSVVLMGLPAVTHGIDTSARRLVLPITSAWNPTTGALTVQVPSLAKAPAGHYYAIALDSRGVPSPARIVQVVGSGSASASTAVAAAPQPEAEVARAVTVAEPPQQD